MTESELKARVATLRKEVEVLAQRLRQLNPGAQIAPPVPESIPLQNQEKQLVDRKGNLSGRVADQEKQKKEREAAAKEEAAKKAQAEAEAKRKAEEERKRAEAESKKQAEEAAKRQAEERRRAEEKATALREAEEHKKRAAEEVDRLARLKQEEQRRADDEERKRKSAERDQERKRIMAQVSATVVAAQKKTEEQLADERKKAEEEERLAREEAEAEKRAEEERRKAAEGSPKSQGLFGGLMSFFSGLKAEKEAEDAAKAAEAPPAESAPQSVPEVPAPWIEKVPVERPAERPAVKAEPIRPTVAVPVKQAAPKPHQDPGSRPIAVGDSVELLTSHALRSPVRAGMVGRVTACLPGGRYAIRFQGVTAGKRVGAVMPVIARRNQIRPV